MSTPAAKDRLLVCNCQRTMEIDVGRLARALGLDAPPALHTELCREQLQSFENAVAGGGPLHIACTQEAALFAEVAEQVAGNDDRSPAPLTFTNIRERAGWHDGKSDPLPKMAALLAEAAIVPRPTGPITLKSEGQCLVYGAGQVALDVAIELSGRLAVTLLLTSADEILPPSVVAMPIARGTVMILKGHLGAFEIEVDGYAPALPSSRGKLEFAMPRDGVRSRCDVILDLSGRAPLVSDAARRDGYLRADPASPAAVARAMLKATDLVGEFEKPIYVSYDAGICAHARSSKVGCSKCLDVCPTGAITPAGDLVAIDAAICGGCGSCSAICPTGAVSYEYPRREDVVRRVRVLLETYRAAGGTKPVLLIHDSTHGEPLISAMARLGRGLPINMLPLKVNAVTSLGHDLMAAMLALGADQLVVLAPPDKPDELPPLEGEADLMSVFLSGLGYQGSRVHVVVERDPDVMERLLHDLPPAVPMRPFAFAAGSNKRDLARVALARLREAAPAPADRISLPAGAPYGRIAIDTKGCTLCLACVGACPANALADNPDRPEVAFTEAACVQCGICVATCPEKVITKQPGYDFTSASLTPRVLYGEEPFQCVKCGKPFGARSSIERIAAKLESHAMFQGGQRDLVRMCDTCRIATMASGDNDPFRQGERPRVRTSDDYFAAEAKATRMGRKPEDFLS